jgi:hypothetical protein
MGQVTARGFRNKKNFAAAILSTVAVWTWLLKPLKCRKSLKSGRCASIARASKTSLGVGHLKAPVQKISTTWAEADAVIDFGKFCTRSRNRMTYDIEQ